MCCFMVNSGCADTARELATLLAQAAVKSKACGLWMDGRPFYFTLMDAPPISSSDRIQGMLTEGRWSQVWDQRRIKEAAERARGLVIITVVKTTRQRGTPYRVRVSCPPNDTFAAHAKTLAGVWRPRTTAWTFPGQAKESVINLCLEVFGPQQVIRRGC